MTTKQPDDELDRVLQELKDHNWKLKYYTRMKAKWEEKIRDVNQRLQALLAELE